MVVSALTSVVLTLEIYDVIKNSTIKEVKTAVIPAEFAVRFCLKRNKNADSKVASIATVFTLYVNTRIVEAEKSDYFPSKFVVCSPTTSS